jgi:hypothetical protein
MGTVGPWQQKKLIVRNGKENKLFIVICQVVKLNNWKYRKHIGSYKKADFADSQAEGRGFESRFPLQK